MTTTQRELPADTTMGAVDLLVRDLDAMTAYYHDGVGLAVLDARGDTVTLGNPEGERILTLRQRADLPAAGPRSAGLYHTAILFPDQAALAGAFLSTVRHPGGAFVGSADHLFSEAFYFSDPEGNGLELYRDRPRREWVYDGAGRLRAATPHLDPNQFLARHLTEGLESGADSTVGHVHLQVGDIPRARAFYVGLLGFDVTIDVGSALFVSAGGYHHHLGMNTWQSAGAGSRTPALGLGEVSIEVPTADDLGALSERLRAKGVQLADTGAEVRFDDPWANLVRVRAAA